MPADYNSYHWYSPRCWHGMRVWDWLRLLARNHFAVTPINWGLATTVTLSTPTNSLLYYVQKLIYGRRIAAAQVTEPPIFIIGHWRSGTTYLHELLVQDPRFTYPDTYACFAPNHFVLSRRFITPWLKYLLPRHRPMDNVLLGWDRPQEDEFALLSMGLPSPYETLAFPNRHPPGLNDVDTGPWPPEVVAEWKRKFRWFLQCVTYRNRRPIVLKSPPHTGRVKTLLELFPDARFIHIVRDPYTLFSSTMRLWRSLSAAQGFQTPRYSDEELEESVLAAFERMYRLFEAQRGLLAPGRLCEVRYERLVRDPIAQMRLIYGQLDLGDFETARPQLERYVGEQADYKINRHNLTPEQREKISRRWSDFLQRYGYAEQPAET